MKRRCVPSDADLERSAATRRWRRAGVRENVDVAYDFDSAAAKAPPEIVCDDRERPSGVVDALRQLGDVQVTVRRLKVGDYLIDGRILVERKTFADFALSIADGRLFQQATGLLKQTSGRALLILEGVGDMPAQTGMRRESLQGAWVTLGVILGIPLLRSRDAADTAQLLRYAARQVCRHARGTLPRAGYRPKRLRRRQLFVLQGLPGVGPERAASLLQACGSVAGVFAAAEETLANVPGIGPRTAALIHRLVRAPAPGTTGVPGEAGASGQSSESATHP